MSAPERYLVLWIAAVVVSMPAVAEQATAARGQEIATHGTPQGVPACIGCHGTQGEGNAAFPRLGGTGQAYLQAQLDAFADGNRKNPVMQPFAQKLSTMERAALAMYYSQLKAPIEVPDAESGDVGATLATRGRWTDQLPACAQCHGPGGSGVGTQFPPLAGLPAAYIAEQLQSWKTGGRPPGPLGLMPTVAGKLSDKEIDAVATYYAGLTTTTTASSPALVSTSAQSTPKGHSNQDNRKERQP
jgi:cytochrome c553